MCLLSPQAVARLSIQMYIYFCWFYQDNLLQSTRALLSSETTKLDHNLTSTQLKLLHKHQQMGHLHMAQIQQLVKDGVFGDHLHHLSTCNPPLCKACIHGKPHKHPLHPSSLHPLDSLHLAPGDCISSDQIESTLPGLIPTYRGSPTTDFYHAGTLFIDHASHLLHFTPHTSTGAKEAITAKQNFELLALSYNRSI